MAIVTRTISNTGDALAAQDGTVLSDIEVTFLLVNSNDLPTDAWDVITGERIAPIKETAVTNASGIFSVSLWPNDRGSSDNPTYYRCTTKSRDMRSFQAALPSGDLSTLSWIEFAGFTNPITSETYGTPLKLTAGDTVPISAIMTDVDGQVVDITDYTINYEITNSINVTVNYPATITSAQGGLYTVVLSDLIVGRYTARLHIRNALSQTEHSTPFIIEVSA